MDYLITLMIVAAVGVFAIAEILISYKKWQLKRDYIKELDEYDTNIKEKESSEKEQKS